MELVGQGVKRNFKENMIQVKVDIMQIHYKIDFKIKINMTIFGLKMICLILIFIISN